MGIPEWTSTGILPPIHPGSDGVDHSRSPYISHIDDLVARFRTSKERCNILDGLLRYREDLHKIGINRGFQWLDGSFMEDIETNENRPPNDIDIVTFFELPDGVKSQNELLKISPELFNLDGVKGKYFVDAYYLQLDMPMNDDMVKKVSYWYSMWSHRRDQTWKGYVQISLDDQRDPQAKANLNAIIKGREA